MFIKSLTIKNFRCFNKDGITINFNDGLTSFIGRNGSGKTAILEALNFLIGQEYLPTRISEKDFHSEAKEIKDEIYIESETKSPFLITLDVREDKFQRLETIVIPCNKIRLTVKRREKPEKVIDDPFVINKYVVPVAGEIDEGIYKEDETARKAVQINKIKDGFTIFYKLKSGDERSAKIIEYQLAYNPNRLTNCPKSYYLTKGREDDVSGNYSLIAKILTDLHWRYKKKRTGGEGASIQGEYDRLATSLRSIIDDKGDLIRKINEKVREISSDDKDFQIDFVDTEQPYKSAFLAKREGDKLLLPEHLGSGYNILIAYALFAYVAGLEKIPIVLVIDEPELHLHSDWQSKMYNRFSTQMDLQIVYSTQSENFVSLKNWQQIRSLANAQLFPKESELSAQIQATDGESGTPADYLNDYSRKNLDVSTILRENLELFFTKKCVLVEGPSEKYALPKLLKLAGCYIEGHSVSIIPAWGKTKIKNYQMICKVFGIDYFTIFDNDKATDDEPTNENTAIENNVQSRKFIKFSSNFEALLGVTGDNKFQKMVREIDGLGDISTVNTEIKQAVMNVKNFIELS